MGELTKSAENTKKFYEKSFIDLGRMEKKPSEKEWNRLADKNFHMTSISMKGYSGQKSWTILYLKARKSHKKIIKLIDNL